VVLPDDVAISSADLFELRTLFLSHKLSLDSYCKGLEELRAQFLAEDTSEYLFAGGKWSAPASETHRLLLNMFDTCPRPSPPNNARPSQVLAAFHVGQVAEATAKGFSKSLATLKKAPTVIADFGAKASTLMDESLANFDEKAASFPSRAAVAEARATLVELMQRAVYTQYKKQLVAVQKAWLAKFRTKLAAMKPSIEVESQLRSLVSDMKDGFNEQVDQLLPAGLDWTPAYERAALVDSMNEQSQLHVDTLTVQGLYLNMDKYKMPIDVSLHWLLPKPFGDGANVPINPAKMKPRKPTKRPKARALTFGVDDDATLEGIDGMDSLPDEMDAKVRAMVFADKMIE